MQAGARRVVTFASLFRHILPASHVESLPGRAISRLLPLTVSSGLPQTPAVVLSLRCSVHSFGLCPSAHFPPPSPANQPQIALGCHQRSLIGTERHPNGSVRSSADLHALRGFATRPGVSRRVSAARSRSQAPSPAARPEIQPQAEQQTTKLTAEDGRTTSAATASSAMSSESGTDEVAPSKDATYEVQPHAADIHEVRFHSRFHPGWRAP